jgi:hypothetical protein
MAKLLQLRRGNTAQHTSFTGEVGEVTVNTEDFTLHVHDGPSASGGGGTASGHKVLNETTAATFGACKTGVTVTSGNTGGISNGSIDFGNGSNQTITVNGAADIDVIAGSATIGQSGSIFFEFTGTALASFSTKFHWAGGQTNVPASSNTSGAVDRLDYIVYDATSGSEKIHAVYTNAVA